VSWQEDLHRLEHDLAMGRLSAEDYRRQRDELLAAANAGQASTNPAPGQPGQQGQPTGTPPGGMPTGTPGAGFPAPSGTPGGGFPAQTGGPGGGFPGQSPTGTPPGGFPGQQQAPFPPAFKWAAQPPAQQQQPPSSSESTQTIRPVGQDNQPPASADATQVVPNNPAMDRTQAVRPGDADRTQVVHNNPFGQQQPPQGGQQTPWRGGDQANLYSSGQMDSMPNWNTGGAFGDWPKQGPEVFDSPGSGKGGKRVLLIVLVVVVLAGLGVGGWLLFGNKSSPQASGGGGPQTSTSHTVAPTTTPKPRPAIDGLVNAPGNPTSQSFTPEQLTTLKPLAKPDLDILGNTSLSKADYVVSQDGTTVLDLWSFTVADQSSATALAKKFDTDQGRFGFEPSDITTDDGQYTAQMSQQQNGSKNIVVYRLHYVVGNEVIRVEAFDPSGEKARADFVKLLQLQTELTPPGK
jgi:hypothetical protein